jgi:hypothetical protein
MSKELVATRKFRAEIPEAHRGSLDTRLRWLWHQRWGHCADDLHEVP